MTISRTGMTRNMKITVNQYAKSLYAAMKDKSPKEINGLTSNLVKILAKNRQIKLADKISEKFGEIWNRENGIVEAEVITGRKIEKHQLNQVKKFIKEKYSAKKVLIENKIDEKIKGGIIIKVGDDVLDGSIERQLQELKSSLEK
jgi:F-type H+-transporting ATPase subunit delta